MRMRPCEFLTWSGLSACRGVEGRALGEEELRRVRAVAHEDRHELYRTARGGAGAAAGGIRADRTRPFPVDLHPVGVTVRAGRRGRSLQPYRQRGERRL